MSCQQCHVTLHTQPRGQPVDSNLKSCISTVIVNCCSHIQLYLKVVETVFAISTRPIVQPSMAMSHYNHRE